jgi:saccharopine dehydrogenase-like NADP-dependent oxidoreductase
MSTPRHRVVILGGAGAMGRITARDFERTARNTVDVVIADRVPPMPGTAAGASFVEVDVTDPKSLRGALDGAFAVIASLPYRFNLQAMHGALAAGAHYVDLGGLFHVTREQMKLAGEFERAECMAILGMGSAPGILNVLAVRAARGMDTVQAIHCMVGAVDRTRWHDLPPLGFGYSPDTLLDEFALDSAVFRDGRFVMVPPLDPAERIEVRFPAPVGKLALDSTLHSEVATLPLSFAARGVREVTFRQGFEREFMDRLAFLVRLGMVDPHPMHPGGVAPRQMLLALLGRFPAPTFDGEPQRYEILRTQVVGRRRGRLVTVNADCHAGPRAGWGIGPDIDTGAPPSIAVQLLAAGEIAMRPGVWFPEQVVPVEPFLRELERRGMRVTCRPGTAPRSATRRSATSRRPASRRTRQPVS